MYDLNTAFFSAMRRSRASASPSARGAPMPMAYQGIDDTPLQKKIAQAYRLAAPSLEWRAPHVGRARTTGRKIRLGIVSRHLTNHTIGKLNIGLAQKFDRSRFEIVVMGLHPAQLAYFADGEIALGGDGREVSRRQVLHGH